MGNKKKHRVVPIKKEYINRETGEPLKFAWHITEEQADAIMNPPAGSERLYFFEEWVTTPDYKEANDERDAYENDDDAPMDYDTIYYGFNSTDGYPITRDGERWRSKLGGNNESA